MSLRLPRLSFCKEILRLAQGDLGALNGLSIGKAAYVSPTEVVCYTPPQTSKFWEVVHTSMLGAAVTVSVANYGNDWNSPARRAAVDAVLVCFVEKTILLQVPERPEARVVREVHIDNQKVFLVYNAITLYDSAAAWRM